MHRKYLAELMGTFMLTFAVALSLGGRLPFPTPLIAGITLGLVVYLIGSISGAHVNPAITLGLWSLRRIPGKEAGMYILFQFIGALIAQVLSRLIAPVGLLVVGNGFSVIFGEFLGAFFFAFGVATVASGKVSTESSGLVVGASLFIGIIFASFLSNGILNPAVALGIGSFSLAYLLGPILGAAAGMHAFNALANSRKD